MAVIDARPDLPDPATSAARWRAMDRDVASIPSHLSIAVADLEAMVAGPPTVEETGFTGLLHAVTDRGDVPLVVPLTIHSQSRPDDGRVVLLGRVPSLTLLLWNDPSGQGAAWRVDADSGDASARADVLDFLWALSGEGRLEIRDARSGARVGTLELRATPFDSELAEDRRFLGDVAMIEAWTGEHLHLPHEVAAASVAEVARAAEVVAARRVPLRVNGPIRVETAAPIDEADELRLEVPISMPVLGRHLDFGVARGSISVRHVRDDGDAVLFEPVDDDARRLVWKLLPPAGFEPTARTGGEDQLPGEGQEWFWTDEWQAAEAAALHQRAVGESIRHEDVDGFLTYLDERAAG